MDIKFLVYLDLENYIVYFDLINFVSILYIIFTILYSYLILMLLIGIIHLFSNPFFLTFIQILSKSLFTHPCHSNACLSGYGLGYNGQPCRLWSYAFLHKYCILLFPFFSVYLMCKKTLRISCGSYSDEYRTRYTRNVLKTQKYFPLSYTKLHLFHAQFERKEKLV